MIGIIDRRFGIVLSLSTLFFLQSCILIPDSFVRTIYWTSQIRSGDLSGVGSENNPSLMSQSFVIDVNDYLMTAVEDQSELSVEAYMEAVKSSHDGSISALAVAKNGIISGSEDGRVMLHRRGEAGQYSHRTLAIGKRPILALSVSPDGHFLAVAQFSLVSLIDLRSFELVSQMTQVKGRILSLAWHPSQESLLFGRVDGNVFSWKLADQIEYSYNSTSVLEVYETESAPVIKLIFHPSSRAFFAATQTGGMFVVRLKKTERELGIDNVRKNSGEIVEGKFVVRFAKLPAQINDAGISADNAELYALSSDGLIYSWGIRGLIVSPTISLPKDSVATISRVGIGLSDVKMPFAFISTGRSLRIRFWCSGSEYYESPTPTLDVVKKEDSGEVGKGGDLSEDELIALLMEKSSSKSSDLLNPTYSEGSPEARGLIFQSPSLRNSSSVVEFDPENGILWLGDKTGKIIRLDAVSLVRSSHILTLIKEKCLKSF
jgi:WD40 repeat protein